MYANICDKAYSYVRSAIVSFFCLPILQSDSDSV